MKKIVKNFLKVGGVIATISLVNKNIKNKADFSIVDDILSTDDLFYKSTNGKIRYKIVGKTKVEKPKILLIHNLTVGASLIEFEKLSKMLAFDYEVYKLDMLGFGRSDKPNIKYNSYLYTSLINEFINNVVKDEVVIISSGLSADFSFMARELNSEKIKDLILINPKGLETGSIYGDTCSKIKKSIIKLPIIGTFTLNILSSKYFIKKSLFENGFYNPVYVTEVMITEYYQNAHFKNEASRFSTSHLVTNFLKVETLDKIKNTEKKTTIILGENINKFDSYKIKEVLSNNKNINISIVPLSKELVAFEKPEEILKECSIILSTIKK